jgi:NADH-quinone oxidoreductase subunit A
MRIGGPGEAREDQARPVTPQTGPETTAELADPDESRTTGIWLLPCARMMLLATTDLSSYLPILLIILMAVSFGAINVIGSLVLGPKRAGTTKAQSYESGMNPVGTARKRFNVRFYLIAMVFLVFDVEIIFLYPWATTFPNIAPMSHEGLIWLGRIFFFLLTTVVAYIYGYRKGVFRFD